MTECRQPPILSTWVFEAAGEEWEIEAPTKEEAWTAIRLELPRAEICFLNVMPGARNNPAGQISGMETADRNFEMWHDKEPSKEILVKNAIDPDQHAQMASIGYATDIIYSSDKWEKDGSFYPYEHDFTSRPKVWVPASSVPPDAETIGRLRSTAGFLGERELGGAKAVAQLAFVEELLYEDEDGVEWGIAVGEKAIMASSPDRKTVIILGSDGPVLISGAQMIITARGIVN